MALAGKNNRKHKIGNWKVALPLSRTNAAASSGEATAELAANAGNRFRDKRIPTGVSQIDYGDPKRREWSRRERSDIDEARKGELSGDSESIEPACRMRTTVSIKPARGYQGGGGNRTRE